MSLLFIVILTGEKKCKANIVIDSVSTTISTCANNGTATLYATSSPNTFLLYAIVNGPAVTGMQNNSTFTSLFPGNYTARIYDINFDSLDATFSITGNYILPSFTPSIVNPTCPGMTDGEINCYPDFNTGTPPFTWQIISPFTSAVQSSGLFTGLSDGNYVIQLTDSCGNLQTRTAVLTTNGTGLADVFGYSGFYPFIKKVGCDSIAITNFFFLYNTKAQMQLKSYTLANSNTLVEDFLPFYIGYYDAQIGVYGVTTIIPNISYGGGSIEVSIQDTCGVMVNYPLMNIPPYQFQFSFGAAINQNCIPKIAVSAALPVYPNYFPTYIMEPWHYTLTNLTGAVVDSGSCDSNCYQVIFMNPQIPGSNLICTITDGCGEVFQQNIIIPPADTPQIAAFVYAGCLDSTATIEILAANMGSAYTIEILSGPSHVQSTKNNYAFSDTIVYPKVFPNQTGLPRFFLKNVPAGIYQYKVTDSCGNSLSSSIEVFPMDLTVFDFKFYFKRTCSASNVIYTGSSNGGMASSLSVFIDVTNVDSSITLASFASYNQLDSIINLPEGTYAITIHYDLSNGGIFYPATQNITDCWNIHDTLVIPPFTHNFFQSQSTITCGGTTYLQLSVDSAQGVAPYQYEIINGPQIFPLQNSNTFVLNQYGIYVIRLIDACGNSYTQQITVDSASFPPINQSGFSCPGSSVQLYGIASPYFSYTWQLPNGTIFIGDTLTINPFTVTDTGTYLVKKIVSINGCLDTVYASYHLQINSIINLNLNLCAGDTAFVGNNFYTLPGIYTDSLLSGGGCDSVVVTTLNFSNNIVDSTYASICSGDSVLMGSIYYAAPGTYIDTVATTSGCSDVHYYFISSAAIYADTVNASICKGSSYNFGNTNFNSSGFYTDTILSASGCDSIQVLNLMVEDNPIVNIQANGNEIIEGSNVMLTANTLQNLIYNWYSNASLSDSTLQTIIATFSNSSWIYLFATDSNGCEATDSIYITVIENPTACPNSTIYIPYAFTPNNDGINDFFKIYGINIELKKLEIYSRWGQLLFKTSNINQSWDGTFKGKIKSDVFAYKLSYVACNNDVKEIQGMLLLVK